MSEESESNHVPVEEVYSWAGQLASESRGLDWIAHGYVWPDAVGRVLRQLKTGEGMLIGLVGLQGVGKSSALLAILTAEIMLKKDELRKAEQERNMDLPLREYGLTMFKWRRQADLFTSLLNDTHEASSDFRLEYAKMLMEEIKFYHRLFESILPKENPERLNIDWAEKKLSKSIVTRLRHVSWLNMLRQKKVILIDTPDYSRTDRRLMTKDLDEIYWLWNWLSQPDSSKGGGRPNLVIAIQKEMFHGHYFFDKMEKIELEPLKPAQMIEAYQKRFKTLHPFTEEALLTLARMSRGIFRRYLRYITLTLDLWTAQPEPRRLIDPETVKKAVTTQRLAEDMDLELSEIFPKQSDLKLQAVRLLLHVQESGPKTQTQLAEELNLEDYAISRLLAKLETHRYVTRRKDGADKIVDLSN